MRKLIKKEKRIVMNLFKKRTYTVDADKFDKLMEEREGLLATNDASFRIARKAQRIINEEIIQCDSRNARRIAELECALKTSANELSKQESLTSLMYKKYSQLLDKLGNMRSVKSELERLENETTELNKKFDDYKPKVVEAIEIDLDGMFNVEDLTDPTEILELEKELDEHIRYLDIRA